MLHSKAGTIFSISLEENMNVVSYFIICIHVFHTSNGMVSPLCMSNIMLDGGAISGLIVVVLRPQHHPAVLVRLLQRREDVGLEAPGRNEPAACGDARSR